ncbi:hypothetical protein F8B97_27950, partial [Klebsiella pneumoniae]|nr:hypothetical protein [Klebsiella pneumoniae]
CPAPPSFSPLLFSLLSPFPPSSFFSLFPPSLLSLFSLFFPLSPPPFSLFPLLPFFFSSSPPSFPSSPFPPYPFAFPAPPCFSKKLFSPSVLLSLSSVLFPPCYPSWLWQHCLLLFLSCPPSAAFLCLVRTQPSHSAPRFCGDRVSLARLPPFRIPHHI